MITERGTKQEWVSRGFRFEQMKTLRRILKKIEKIKEMIN